MKALVLLITYQAVSASFSWSFGGGSSNNNNNNQLAQNDDYHHTNLMNDLLNDMKMDISFNPNTKSQYTNQYTMNQPQRYQQPRYQTMNYMPLSQSQQSYYSSYPQYQSSVSNKPLYLMVESSPSVQIHPKQQQSSTYTLTQTNKVNGDTYRYTVNSNPNGQQVSETWTNSKMYLCQDEDCTSKNGMEMTNVFDGDNRNYMHLIPTSTLEPLWPDMTHSGDDEDKDSDNFLNVITALLGKAKNAYKTLFGDSDTDLWDSSDDGDWFDSSDDSWNDEGTFTIGGTINLMGGSSFFTDIGGDLDKGSETQLNSDYGNGISISLNGNDVGVDDAEVDNGGGYIDYEAYEAADGDDNEYGQVDGFVLADDGSGNVDEGDGLAEEEKHDLVVVEMTVLIIFIMICGVLYGGYRFLLDRREKQRELDYLKSNMSSPL